MLINACPHAYMLTHIYLYCCFSSRFTRAESKKQKYRYIVFRHISIIKQGGIFVYGLSFTKNRENLTEKIIGNNQLTYYCARCVFCENWTISTMLLCPACLHEALVFELISFPFPVMRNTNVPVIHFPLPAMRNTNKPAISLKKSSVFVEDFYFRNFQLKN